MRITSEHKSVHRSVMNSECVSEHESVNVIVVVEMHFAFIAMHAFSARVCA